jgi:carbamoyltransferase
MLILGISAFYHDSAACLVRDGRVIAAAQEERFTRKKHDFRFPQSAISYCLVEAGVSLEEIGYVVFYEKPFVKFERLLESYMETAPRGFKSFSQSMPIWLKEKLFLKKLIAKELKNLQSELHGKVYLEREKRDTDGGVGHTSIEERILFSTHHLSHAASAFYPSPFLNSAILTMDGVGEYATTSLSVGKNNAIEVICEQNFPHSLGLLYSSFTSYLGFKVNSGEYKIMGLAPYGRPKYAQLILDNLIDIKQDGSFFLNMEFFNFVSGLTMTNSNFHELFGDMPKEPETKLTQRDMDIASSIQSVLDQAVLKIAKYLAEISGERNICLAGGVALNCVSNGHLQRSGLFDNVWIQPAAGDAGGALGAALAVHHMRLDQPRVLTKSFDGMSGSFLGPEFDDTEIVEILEAQGARYRKLDEPELLNEVAAGLVAGAAVGWFQGRMEFGPRSLGNRSILADPRSPDMQKILNLKIKFRESFRPFAPSVLAENLSEWFALDVASPYMLIVAEVNENKRLESKPIETNNNLVEGLQATKSVIPAVTHVDFSARIQTVHKELNPKFHSLIQKFKDLTGVPLLVNTSFNIRGEPIVCTPIDAFNCFMGTGLDILVLGNIILFKKDQLVKKSYDYREKIALD